jgi:phosphopantothenoylcysteine decarboxylase/phosphopantothenate--cysteine ligase
MKVIVTAGATREYIDPVRYITNASSGKMGCAVAAAAVEAGHSVTAVLAQGVPAPPGCDVVRFAGVDDLAAAIDERFAECDALVMAAAVGDFRPETPSPVKLPREGGPIKLTLLPVADILAALGRRKRSGQTIVAFAVRQGTPDELVPAARDKLARKGADFIVVNTPEAMAADESTACILSPEGVALGWAVRPKRELAEEIVALLRRVGR